MFSSLSQPGSPGQRQRSDGHSLSVYQWDDSASLGAVVGNSDGSFTYDPNGKTPGQFAYLHDGETAGDTFRYRAVDVHGALGDWATVTVTITGVDARVVGRRIFYDNSYWDSGIAGPNDVEGGTDHDEDDDAIAPDKEALVGDGVTQATSLNYANFSGGITGIMIDVGGLANPAEIDTSDFVFRYGNDETPYDWTIADDTNSHSPSRLATRDIRRWRHASRSPGIVSIAWLTSHGDFQG